MGDVAAADKRIVLEELSVMTGNTRHAHGDGAGHRGRQDLYGRHDRRGPGGRRLRAVESLVDGDSHDMRLRDFRMEAITGGSDALAEVMVGVEDNKGRMVTARAAREDIVQASVEALVSAMNRLSAMPKKPGAEGGGRPFSSYLNFILIFIPVS